MIFPESKEIFISRLNKVIEVIYEGIPYYAIIHIPSGHGAMLDHEDWLIESVKRYIEEHGSSLTVGPRGTLRFLKPRKKDSSTETKTKLLSAFLSELYEPTTSDVKKSVYVRRKSSVFLSNGLEDCRKNSLVRYGGIQRETANRTFRKLSIHGYDILELRMDKCIKPAYFTYDERLFEILANTDVFTTFSVDGKGYVQVYVRLEGETKSSPVQLAQIVIAIRDGLLTTENIQNIRAILDEMKNYGALQTDHLNSDKLNNCYHNLSLMTGFNNELKLGYTDTFSDPYTISWAFDWIMGSYLIQIVSTETGSAIRYRCRDEDIFLNFLTTLCNRNPLTKNLTAFSCGETVMQTPGAVSRKNIARHQAAGLGRLPKMEENHLFQVVSGAALLKANTTEFDTFIDVDALPADAPATQTLSALCNNLGSPILPGTPVGFRVVKELSVTEAKEYRKKLRASAIR